MCSIIIQIKMCFWYRNHIDITIQTAIECKVCHLWIYMIVWCIIYCNYNFIFISQKVCYIHSPCRVSTIMMSSFFSINIKPCTRVCSVKLNISDWFATKLLTLHVLYIVTCTAVVIISTILSILTIPCMRQVKCLPVALC